MAQLYRYRFEDGDTAIEVVCENDREARSDLEDMLNPDMDAGAFIITCVVPHYPASQNALAQDQLGEGTIRAKRFAADDIQQF